MENAKRKLAAIMFTDMVGYSAISNRNETLALELLRNHRLLIRPVFTQHGGREIKSMGDGFLVEFSSAVDAVQCAIRIQTIFLERNREQPLQGQVRLRIGIHLGDIISSGDDVYGDGVNIAARLETLAEPGGICFSQQIYDQVKNKLNLPIRRMGSRKLKNIRGQVSAYFIQIGSASRTLGAARRSDLRIWLVSRKMATLTALLIFAAGAANLLAGLGRFSHLSPAPGIEKSAQDKYRVAVLPFVNLGANSEEDFLADGFTEELISSLARISTLRVIARTSMTAFQSSGKSARQIGQELNVGTILEGSVRSNGKSLRVSVRMIDARSDENLWSQDFDDQATQIFQMQKKIAQSVTQRLKFRQISSVKGSGWDRANAPSFESYMQYLKGRFFLNRRTEESIHKAMGHFQEAIRLDPNFAAAYVGMASSYGLMGFYQYLAPKDSLVQERRFVDRALELDPHSPEALTSTASRKAYYDHDWAAAESYFNRAIELKPGNPAAHAWFGEFLVARERPDEARRELSLALELDPLSLMVNTTIGHPDYFSGKFDAAIKRYSAALEMDPGFIPANLWLGRALLQKKEYSKALFALQKASILSEGAAMMKGALGIGYALSGDSLAARKILSELLALAKVKYVSSYDLAGLYLGLGERSEALRYLNLAFDERSFQVIFLGVDPAFVELKDDRGFQKLLRRINAG